MKYFISPEQVIELKKQGENLVILDSRYLESDPDYIYKTYQYGHIKGALPINIETQVTGKVDASTGNHPLPDFEKLREDLENLGISNDSLIVAYDDGELIGPSRLVVTLDLMGLKRLKVMTGGFMAYLAAGGEIEEGPARLPEIKGQIDMRLDLSRLVDLDYIRKHKDQEGVILLDTRNPLSYEYGHIPGAKNRFVGDIKEKYSLADLDQIRAHYQDLADYDQVIISCGSGMVASLSSLAMREIGLDHKFYIDGYSQWAKQEGR